MPRLRLQRIVIAVALAALALPVGAQPVATALPTLPPNAAANAALPSDSAPALPSDGTTALPSDGGLPALNLPLVKAPVVAAVPPAQPTNSGLPSVVPSSAAAATVGPDGADAAVAEPAPPGVEKTYSFGDSSFSILFLPDQVNRMKDALRTFEDTGNTAALPTPPPEAANAVAAPEVIEDPLVYPIFYLASIAYDAPNDWSLWISGYKITSRKNDTDVTVLNVTRDSATFLWTPSFSKAVARRTKDKLFAPIDPVKNKLAGVQRASFDAGTGSVVFTLKQNQSFAAGYFKVFEGYIDSPALTALPVVGAAPANGAPVTFDANGQPLPTSGQPNPPPNREAGAFAPPSTNFNNGPLN